MTADHAATLIEVSAAVLAAVVIVALIELRLGRTGRVARLHVVLQFELSSGQWDDAETDITDLERLGGSWPDFSRMVRQTIAAGRARQIEPPTGEDA
jgi:hypothetical protein